MMSASCFAPWTGLELAFGMCFRLRTACQVPVLALAACSHSPSLYSFVLARTTSPFARGALWQHPCKVSSRSDHWTTRWSLFKTRGLCHRLSRRLSITRGPAFALGLDCGVWMHPMMPSRGLGVERLGLVGSRIPTGASQLFFGFSLAFPYSPAHHGFSASIAPLRILACVSPVEGGPFPEACSV